MVTQAGAVVKPRHYLNRITPHFGLHSILEGLLRSAGISVFLVLWTTSLAVLQKNHIESDKRALGCRGSSLVTAVLSERGQSSVLQSTCMDLGQCFKVFI